MTIDKMLQSSEANLKDTDIVNALVNLVSLQCGCDFTTSQLTDRVFLCDPSSPNAVTYQAQLHGTRHANVSQLASIIQGLSQETTSIPVQLSLLTIQRFCIVSSTSLSPCSQNDERSALSVNIIIAVVVVIIVIVLIVVIAGIIMTYFVRRRNHGKHAK